MRHSSSWRVELRLVGVVAVALAILPSAAPGATFAAPIDKVSTTRAADYSLSFTGTDSGVTVRDSASLQLDRKNAFTVAFWTYLRRIDNNPLPRFWEKNPHYLCVMGDSSNAQFGKIGLEVANASGTGNQNGGVTEFWGSTRLRTNTWYFIAATFDGSKQSSQAQIYVNGAPEQMRIIYPWSGQMFSTAGRAWAIGRRLNDLARGLDGQLDAMVVYPTAFTRRQIQALYRGRYPAFGAIADWEFNEGFGSVVNDSSGNGNVGAITDATYVAR